MGVVTLIELRHIAPEDVGTIRHLAVSHLGRELFIIDEFEPRRGGIGRYPDGQKYYFASLEELANQLWNQYEANKSIGKS